MSVHLHKYIVNLLRESLLETAGEVWYHGTPDVREIEKLGGFTEKTITLDYVKDPTQFRGVQNQLNDAKKIGDEDLYFKILDTVKDYKANYTMKKPIFLTNNSGVARTYADASRSIDYQNAVEKVLQVKVNPGKLVTINAPGDRFRFIDASKVKRGFLAAGTSEENFDRLFNMFNWYVRDKNGIKTDMVAAIGQWLEYDTIDVVGVLDSYNGGSVKSTVRMVFDPSNITLIS